MVKGVELSIIENGLMQVKCWRGSILEGLFEWWEERSRDRSSIFRKHSDSVVKNESIILHFPVMLRAFRRHGRFKGNKKNRGETDGSDAREGEEDRTFRCRIGWVGR